MTRMKRSTNSSSRLIACSRAASIGEVPMADDVIEMNGYRIAVGEKWFCSELDLGSLEWRGQDVDRAAGRPPALLAARCTRALNHGLRLAGRWAGLLRRGVGLSTVPRRASSRPCRSPWMVRRVWCLGGLERLRRMCLGLSLILGMLRR